MSFYDHFNTHEQAILQARAERIARLLDDEGGDDGITALAVTLRSERHALPIDSVLNVYRNIPVVPVPCVEPHVAGIANVRGHIMPVFDLATLLNVPGEVAVPARPLVVVSNRAITIALCVEEIGEVFTIGQETVKPVKTTQDGGSDSRLQGVLADGTVLLDLAALLDDPSLVVDEVVG